MATLTKNEQPAQNSAPEPLAGYPAFEREDRYMVLKYKDIAGAFEAGGITESDLDVLSKISGEVEACRMIRRNKVGEFFKCVVVESDWPEYEMVWKMIEERMTQAG